MIKKFPLVALVIITILLQFIISCQRLGRVEKRNIYRMPLSDQIQTLNPREVRFVMDDMVMKAIFGQLIGVDNNGYLAPKICYKWEISSDFKEYTFFIRNDVTFHDGYPLTAKDIKFSFEYEGKKPTLLHNLFSPI